MNKFILILSTLILLIGLSCARNEDTFKDYTVAGEKTGIDTTAPTISSTTPANGTKTDNSSISATFSEVMDNSTISNSTFTIEDSSKNSVSGTMTTNNEISTFSGIQTQTIACCKAVTGEFSGMWGTYTISN